MKPVHQGFLLLMDIRNVYGKQKGPFCSAWVISFFKAESDNLWKCVSLVTLNPQCSDMMKENVKDGGYGCHLLR